MKQTPELDRVQARMQPGVLTLNGFLGSDGRRLADILAADGAVVHSHGVTHRQLAARLDELTRRGRDLMEGEVELDGTYAVRVRDDRGVMPSPWGDGNFGKGEVEMRHLPSGKTFRWNELTLHLVRMHGFYGGHGSEYRLEPNDLIHILGIKPDSEEEEGSENGMERREQT